VAPASAGYGATTLIGVILLGGAGAWLYMRGRKIQISGRVVRKLVIDETKSLGSRQYLVVASYEGKKFMLGVCPGRIDLLDPARRDDGAKEGIMKRRIRPLLLGLLALAALMVLAPSAHAQAAAAAAARPIPSS
jgi:hypothetical protein